MKNKFTVLIAMIVLLGTFPVTKAQTQQNDLAPDRFYMYPVNPPVENRGKLIYELKPGDSYRDEFILKNETPYEKKFEIYITDRYQDKKNQTVYKDLSEKRDMAGWINVDQREVTLKSGEAKKITLNILVPKDVKQDTYLGGIAAINTRPSENNANINIAVRFIMGLEIKITDSPRHIQKVGEANIFSPQTYYFPLSVAIFLGSMAYFTWEKIKENKRKKAAAADGQNGQNNV